MHELMYVKCIHSPLFTKHHFVSFSRNGHGVVFAVSLELTSIDTISCDICLSHSRILVPFLTTNHKWLPVSTALLFPTFLHTATQSWDFSTTIGPMELSDSILLRAESCFPTLVVHRSQLPALP